MEEYIKILNKLGPLYHSYFGIYPEENDPDHVHYWTCFNYSDVFQLIMNGATVTDNCSNEIVCETTINNPNQIDDITAIYDYTQLIRESKTKLPYKTITLKYNGSYHDIWSSMPREWYNNPSVFWRNENYKPYLKKYILPSLKTRPYIIVVKPFMEVKLKAKKKGDKLTIDDVSFATRALIEYEAESIDGGYKVLSVTDDSLILEPKLYCNKW